MSKILKWGEYRISEERAIEIIDLICSPVVNESNSDDNSFDVISKKLSKDLKFNIGLIFTFGAGIKLMMPVVNGLIKTGSFNFELNSENLILLTITVAAIIYLEETSNKAGDEVNQDGEKSIVTKRDVQTMLEELKMGGIGQGIVKKFANAFSSIALFFKNLFKKTPFVINGLLDMFAYTSLMLPCMNAISSFIGKYDITIDNLSTNLLSVGVGVGALMAKQGVSWLVNKLKKSLNIKGDTTNLDIPIEIRPYDIIDSDAEIGNSKLIKEQ
jgi:hypothetical protein